MDIVSRGYIFLLSLFVAVVLVPGSSLSAHLVKDKDGTIRIVEDEGDTKDQFGQIASSESEKDSLSKDVLQSDNLRRQQYITIVNEGVKYMDNEQYAQAVDKFESAIKLEPALSYAYINLGNAYWHLKRYEEAIEASKKALQIEPDDARAHANLGNAYYDSGRRKEAKESYQKAKELFQKIWDLEGVKKMERNLARL